MKRIHSLIRVVVREKNTPLAFCVISSLLYYVRVHLVCEYSDALSGCYVTL